MLPASSSTGTVGEHPRRSRLRTIGEAINFYQAEGLLHGRATIHAVDPGKTAILGNHESVYRHAPISCAGYPWYARMFMKEHIEIENDPRVWNQIKAMVESFIAPGSRQS